MKLSLPPAILTPQNIQNAFEQLMKVLNGGIDEDNLRAGAIVPIGAINDWAGSADPAGGHFFLCDGRAISRVTYAALFAIVGTTYGVGDGSTTFNIPDFRGRTSVMVDGAAARLAANDTLGASAGEEKHTLALAELAAHDHSGLTGTTVPNVQVRNTPLGTSRILGSDGSTAGAAATAELSHNHSIPSAGSDTPHNNMQPYLVVNKIIRAA